MLIVSITLVQVETLEGIFAQLTESGWVIPLWLVALRDAVETRDTQAR